MQYKYKLNRKLINTISYSIRLFDTQNFKFFLIKLCGEPKFRNAIVIMVTESLEC